MVTMIDEIYDRNYGVARAELNASLSAALKRAGSAIDNAFGVLNRIEYQAPWSVRPKHARSH